ncbi:MAG: malonyl-[acyl-carrier protein] O-methyltransferase BioC, partial [Gammaproteobacteria bacterium HGW-Gammaproteobacteria-7]
MTAIFDTLAQYRNSQRAAAGYGKARVLQAEVQDRLLDSLSYLDDRKPAVALDVGCGPGHVADALAGRWPRARVLAIDWSPAMLAQAGTGRWWRRRPNFDRVCADAGALPLAEGSVDLIVSNLCLHHIADLARVFEGFRRVLRPGGLLLFSVLGPHTLHELRDAFSQIGAEDPVHPFPSIQRLGDALMASGFRDPVLDRESLTVTYRAFADLLGDLRASSGANALAGRCRGLSGRNRLAAVGRAYEAFRRDGVLPSTWEIIYAHAWAPEPGAPRREGGVQIASIPLDA